jgi:small subunit ribosomal protein S20
MANIKSSKKDLKRNAKNRARNQMTKSALKTYVKKVRQSLPGEVPTIEKNVVIAVKQLDKAAQRGIIHKNQAARRKSRIAKAANVAIAAKS